MAATVLASVVLRSSRVDAVVSFYRALGLEFVLERHGAGPPHYACALGDAVLEIYPRHVGKPDVSQGAVTLYVQVDSVTDTLEALAAVGFPQDDPFAEFARAGVRIAPADRPTVLGSVRICDPDGRDVMINRRSAKLRP